MKIKDVIVEIASTAKEYAAIFLVIGLLAIASYLAWKFGDDDWKDFGLNTFTEVLGIGVTVFLIDQLLKNQERRKRRPLEIAAFQDVQSFVNGLATHWINVYNWSGKNEMAPPPPPSSTTEFLTPSYFEAIRQRLNLDAEACVFPKRTWWEYLPQCEKQYRELGEKILERHAASLDPHAYQLVHKVLNGFLSPSIGLELLTSLKQTGGFGDQEIWNQLPENQRHRLGRYWVLLEDNLIDFALLHQWYQCHKKEFLGHD